MKTLMTQRINENGENVGGLYLDCDHIGVVFFDRTKEPTGCHIQMKDGTVYQVAHTLSEIMDMIIRQGQRTLADMIRIQCNAYELRMDNRHILDLVNRLEYGD